MGPVAFLDTSYAVALANSRDQLHELARRLGSRLTTQRTRLVTTRAILFEIGNHFTGVDGRPLGARVLTALQTDRNVEVVEITTELYEKAVRLYTARPDKEWGLIDCASFVVMQERGIADALTYDEHFTQAGFVALLRLIPGSTEVNR
ncbi:MAG: PIN domain-containing protein [Gemmataceae bacterium]